MKTTNLDRTRDTMHIIATGAEVVMFSQAKKKNNKLGEITHSKVFNLDCDKIYNGTFIKKQTVCSCGCGQQLVLFHYDSCKFSHTFFQAKLEDIQSMSRNDYDNNF